MPRTRILLALLLSSCAPAPYATQGKEYPVQLSAAYRNLAGKLDENRKYALAGRMRERADEAAAGRVTVDMPPRPEIDAHLKNGTLPFDEHLRPLTAETVAYSECWATSLNDPARYGEAPQCKEGFLRDIAALEEKTSHPMPRLDQMATAAPSGVVQTADALPVATGVVPNEADLAPAAGLELGGLAAAVPATEPDAPAAPVQVAAVQPVAEASPTNEPATHPLPARDTTETTGVEVSYLIGFDWNADTLDKEAEKVIDLALTDLHNIEYSDIAVNGHTDTSGTQEYNMALSQRRADAVAGRLILFGIPEPKVITYAFGETDPLEPTEDDVRSAKNRRVELVIE